MITEDQSGVIAFLTDPPTYHESVVELVETHGSIVFLAGARAYKLKRAVRYDYMDFSTVERRRILCEAELALNHRTAPAIYRRVVAVTLEPDGSFALGGAGTAVEWLVEMNRFPQEAVFDRLAADGRLDLALMPPLADAIVALYASAEQRTDQGGRDGLSWVIEGNAAGFTEFGSGCFDPAEASRVTAACRQELARQAMRAEERRTSGFVRHCHGDLHLRNIVLIDGRPTLFDGVEFNDRIACTDVLYDLAFLLMDLWHRRLPAHANTVWNRVLAATEDFGGIRLLSLFLALRAGVRAKTAATAAHVEGGEHADLRALAREYLGMAAGFLAATHPVMIAVGGLSGSGKSTLARAIAPVVGAAPGAVVLRSDEIRKRLCGVAPLDRLGPEGYAAEISTRVYATLAAHAGRVIRAGHSVIVDAVYARPDDRTSIKRAAATAAVPFIGFWLEAAETVRVARAEARHGDASDAKAAVIAMQRSPDLRTIGWRRLDASAPPDAVRQAACEALREWLPGSLNETAVWPERYPTS